MIQWMGNEEEHTFTVEGSEWVKKDESVTRGVYVKYNNIAAVYNS